METSSAELSFAYYQAEGKPQAAYRWSLDPGGSGTVSGSGSSRTLAGLTDGRSYTVTVEVQSSAGLWSAPESVSFAVEYAAPPPAVLEVEFVRESGAAVITISTPSGTPAAESVTLERRVNGRDWHTVTEGLAPNVTVVDPVPSIRGVTEYRAVTVSPLPSTGTGPVAVLEVAEPGWVFVNCGPGWESVRRFWGNPRLSARASRPRALQAFAGRTDLVEMSGDRQDLEVTVSGVLTPDSSTVEEMEELGLTPGEVMYRAPDGRRVIGSIGEVSTGWMDRHRSSVSFTVTRVRREP
ncbi:hypothetical protein [Serinibacter salmoneus]|uniref:hypothetical protein n=1 Tax=Serinibacter salmoneus TaxID=556530 RepID=UPI00117B9D52|nr:hypothetical protein [Serinibacter salmoneus]